MTDEIIRLTRAQVREYDRRAIEEYGIPGIVLMANAARGVADAVSGHFHPESVLILCGNGNNGGDGYALAPMLLDRGIDVKVLRIDPSGKLSPDAAHYLNALQQHKIAMTRDLHGKYDLLIDAMFGTGLTRSLVGSNAETIKVMNASGVQILAIDVPSGLDCDTGEPLGPCVRATMTVTFVAQKIGFANRRSREYLGDVIIAEIGAPRELIDLVRR